MVQPTGMTPPRCSAASADSSVSDEHTLAWVTIVPLGGPVVPEV